MANMTSSAPAAVISAELASAQIEELAALIERYRDDPRQQVKKACERASRRLEKERREQERVRHMYEQMVELGGNGVVVGVDEVGRGSLLARSPCAPFAFPQSPSFGASMTASSLRRHAVSYWRSRLQMLPPL